LREISDIATPLQTISEAGGTQSPGVDGRTPPEDHFSRGTCGQDFLV
jgi:hypothetical protein